MIRVKLANGKYVNVESEEDAAAVAESEGASAKSLEEGMKALQAKTAESEAIQAEVEELKGELSVYKEKLDELLSEEKIEHAAAEMVEESGEAAEITENAPFCNEEGEEDEEKKKEFMNALKGVWGGALYTKVLEAVGVKVENMSPEALRGAFKAQAQVCRVQNAKRAAASKKATSVAGASMVAQNAKTGTTAPVQRDARARLGLGK